MVVGRGKGFKGVGEVVGGWRRFLFRSNILPTHIVLFQLIFSFHKTKVVSREENNAFKLWIPDNSDFVANNEWLETNAPMDIR